LVDLELFEEALANFAETQARSAARAPVDVLQAQRVAHELVGAVKATRKEFADAMVQEMRVSMEVVVEEKIKSLAADPLLASVARDDAATESIRTARKARVAKLKKCIDDLDRLLVHPGSA
jgi:hypothetical protein